jgi:hypothetical protein
MLSPSVKGSLLKGSVKRMCVESEIGRQRQADGRKEGCIDGQTNRRKYEGADWYIEKQTDRRTE